MEPSENKYKLKYNKYKLKYLKLKQLGHGSNKLDTPIKVMTWNVCWEALDGVKSRNLKIGRAHV